MVEALWAVAKRMFMGPCQDQQCRINRYLDEGNFRPKEFSKDNTYDDTPSAFAKGTFRVR